MFGNKARRIKTLEDQLGRTNDLMAKYRDHANRIRKILGVDEETSIVAILEDIRGVSETPEGANLLQWIIALMAQHREHVTLLTGAAKVFQGSKTKKTKTVRKTKKTGRKKT